VAQWPGYVLDGAARRAAGEEVDGQTALRRLIEASVHLLDPGASLEVPAVPVAVAGDLVAVHQDGCFCAMQRLVDAAGRPADLCLFTGDVLAAAAGLHSGRPFGADPASRSASGECVFSLHNRPDPVAARVHEVFLDCLDVNRPQLVPSPVGAPTGAGTAVGGSL
jgi:hypothetical protein